MNRTRCVFAENFDFSTDWHSLTLMLTLTLTLILTRSLTHSHFDPFDSNVFPSNWKYATFVYTFSVFLSVARIFCLFSSRSSTLYSVYSIWYSDPIKWINLMIRVRCARPDIPFNTANASALAHSKTVFTSLFMFAQRMVFRYVIWFLILVESNQIIGLRQPSTKNVWSSRFTRGRVISLKRWVNSLRSKFAMVFNWNFKGKNGWISVLERKEAFFFNQK